MHSRLDERPRTLVRIARFLVAAWILIHLPGCGSRQRSYVDVEGAVSVDGKPAAGATVMFFPTHSSARYVSTGQVGEDGKFKLVTEMKQGLPAGNYEVTVIWPDPSVKPNELQRMQGIFEDGPDLLKGRYANRNASGLKADIEKGQKEVGPFALKSN